MARPCFDVDDDSSGWLSTLDDRPMVEIEPAEIESQPNPLSRDLIEGLLQQEKLLMQQAIDGARKMKQQLQRMFGRR